MSGDASSTTASVFALLGNEVRLEILKSLYEQTVKVGPMSTTATYTAIKEDIGVSDSGRFSYHLDKLTGRFIETTDDGYRLLEPGIETVRLTRTELLTSDRTAGPVPVDGECYRCGDTPSVRFVNGTLITYCEGCAGGITHNTLPDGALSVMGYPPSGVDPDDLEVAFERALDRAEKYDQMMRSGFCPHCCGDASTELICCTDHRITDGRVCSTCERSHAALVQLSCEGCGHHRITHPLFPASEHEAVSTILADAGADSTWDRVSQLMRWPATVREEGIVAYDAPDGRTFVVEGVEIRVET